MAPEPQKPQPYLRIIEQPKSNALRLEYSFYFVKFTDNNSDSGISARAEGLELSRVRHLQQRGKPFREFRFVTTRKKEI